MSEKKKRGFGCGGLFVVIVGLFEMLAVAIGVLTLYVAIRNPSQVITIWEKYVPMPTTTPIVIVPPTYTPLPTHTPYPTYTPYIVPTPELTEALPTPTPVVVVVTATSTPVPTELPSTRGGREKYHSA
jgi:hypothetical protein